MGRGPQGMRGQRGQMRGPQDMRGQNGQMSGPQGMRGQRGGMRGPRGGRRHHSRKHHGMRPFFKRRHHGHGKPFWWKNRDHTQNSVANQFGDRKKQIWSQVKQNFNDCMNMQNNKHLCKRQAKKHMHMLWKQFHQQNWRENIMRWNVKDKKMRDNAEHLVQTIREGDWKAPQYYKEKMQKFHDLKQESMDQTQKSELFNLKKMMKNSLTQ